MTSCLWQRVRNYGFNGTTLWGGRCIEIFSTRYLGLVKEKVMKGITHRISMVLTVLTVLTVASVGMAQTVAYYQVAQDGYSAGDLVVQSGDPAIGLVGAFVGGPDLVDRCVACNQDLYPGAGGDSDYSVILGYSGAEPDGSSQWIWFEIFGQNGALVDGEVLANGFRPDGTPYDETDFTEVFDDGTGEATASVQIAFGPSAGLADVFSNVVIVPEPASASILAWGLMSLIGLVRRR